MTTSAPQDDLAPMSQSDVKLPCDVLLPPNTIIRKGCSVTTLMLALFQRTHFPEADTVLDRRASPAPAAPQDSETVTEEMVVAALAAAMKTSEDEVRRFYPGSDFASMRRALTAALAAKAKG